MSKNYLDPKKTMSARPAADNNVDAMGPCCLDINAKTAYLMKGRWGMAWLFIWGIFLFPTAIILIYILALGSRDHGFAEADLAAISIEVLLLIVATVIVFALSLIYPIHVLRTHLPLRFSRKTRKVYFYHKGKTYISEWDTIRASLEVQSNPTGSSAGTRDPQVNIEFQREDGTTLTVYLIAATRFLIGTSHYEDAAAFWEYIRRYMEEGPKKLPEPVILEPDLDLPGLLRDNNPLPVSRNDTKLVIVIALILLPFRLAFFVINYPTDVVYYFLNKRIKRNPYPPELKEPCRCNKASK